MSDTERIRQLEAEIADVRELVERQARRLGELEARLAQDSHNSSKPPSSDGLARRRRVWRMPSGKKPGGQSGHRGHTLEVAEDPDAVVTHRPTACCRCRQALGAELPAARVERRQVRDVPSLCLEVTEHQAVALRCPACQAVIRGTFPADVRAAAQYGPRLRALAVDLHED